MYNKRNRTRWYKRYNGKERAEDEEKEEVELPQETKIKRDPFKSHFLLESKDREYQSGDLTVYFYISLYFIFKKRLCFMPALTSLRYVKRSRVSAWTSEARVHVSLIFQRKKRKIAKI